MGKKTRRPAIGSPLKASRMSALRSELEHMSVVDRMTQRIERLLDENRFFALDKDEDCFRDTLNEIKTNGEVLPVEGLGYDQYGNDIAWCGTAGALLIGHAEIFLQWPIQYKRQGLLIIDDLMKRAYAGNPIHLTDGKRCVAIESKIAYQALAVPVQHMSFDRHGEQYLFCKAASKYRLLHLPVCLELEFVADLREHVAISCTIGKAWNAMKPIKRAKDGTMEFTGLAQMLVPSESWMKVGLDFCVARLVGVSLEDDEFVDNGEAKTYTIITPVEFLAAMKEYDNDGLSMSDDELLRVDESLTHAGCMEEPPHLHDDWVSTYAH